MFKLLLLLLLLWAFLSGGIFGVVTLVGTVVLLTWLLSAMAYVWAVYLVK